MAKEFAKQFYQSPAWKKCRKAFISYRRSLDGGLCEICHERPGFIVHHKILLTPANINDPDVTLNFGNLQYVCLECHDRLPGHFLYDESNFRRTIFDEDGNPIGVEGPPEKF